ncbi:MAG TPA: DNA polymerase/3'-5' exonuclease PolX [bacterium]|nr:DNA polymerase/3'-5' exonuclease PolX [bacterium]
MSPRNLELARLLSEIADFLELKEESSFRVNAYRKGARAIEGLSEDVAAIAARGELRKIAGIGAGLADKIDEYVRTGAIAYHETLRGDLPAGLPELMTIPEVGPKTALLLYRELGVADVEALEQACRDGRVRALPRLGARSEANILKGIERRRQQGTRHPAFEARPLVDAVVEALGRVPGVEAVSVAGSLRRMRDTVADIDIVVATVDAAAVMTALVALPQVAQVLAKGPTRATVLLGRAAVQCDVRVVEPASYGAALQYFTGSKDHNVQLREIAVRRGLRIDEYGVYNVAEAAAAAEGPAPGAAGRVGGATEEEVYGAVGLPWIPPEIREGQGEIAAAQRGELPALVALEEIRGDLHMHTQWSDGKDTAEVMARAAAARGYAYCCITDHSQSLKFARGVTVDDLRAHAASVRALSDTVGVRVLMGAEVDILADGSLDYPDGVLAELDLVIGSVHSRFRMPRDEMTKRVVRALEHPHLDLLGHPTGRLIGERPPYDLDVDAVIDAARRTGAAIEINASPDRLDLPDVHVRLARERGVFVAVNTDAHQKAHLAFMPYGVGVARRGWMTAAQVLNAWPLTTLLEFLAR